MDTDDNIFTADSMIKPVALCSLFHSEELVILIFILAVTTQLEGFYFSYS